MNAKWLVSDVLATPPELDGTADLVYTGRGAINWIMDIDSWAHVVARLLKPSGRFYLFEGHPITVLFKMDASDLTVDPVYHGYFSKNTYESKGWPDTYVGKIKDRVEDEALKYERVWPISRVISALLGAGLILEIFDEHPDAYWAEFPNMPEEARTKIPNTFSVLMKKPEK
jgi:hypothetical protein